MAKVENDKIINLEPNCLKKVKGKTMTLKELIIKCDRCGEILTDFGGLAFSPPLNDKHTKTHLCRDCWKLFEVWKREKL